MDAFQRSVPPDGTEPEGVVEALQRTNERGFLSHGLSVMLLFPADPLEAVKAQPENSFAALRVRTWGAVRPRASSQWGRSPAKRHPFDDA